MNLIKKTVILTSGAAEGYVSVIRVGSDIGAKIVGENFEKGMRAGIKIGRSDLIFAELDGPKTEITVDNASFHTNDAISCTVLKGGAVVARGGNAVKAKDIIDHFAALENKPQDEIDLAVTALNTVETQENNETISGDAADTNIAESFPEEVAEDPVEENEEPSENEARSILEKLGARDGAEFYNGIREKLDELFVIYPREERLTELLPNSEWVKIAYDGDDYYTVGKIYENGRPVLLAYGVPGKKSVTPPKIANEISSWLSVDGLDNGYDGYWLIFQDAVTGKVVPSDQS